MSIYKSAINKPITTLLIFVAIVILGVFSYRKLPVDQFPEMEPPYISVMTTYAGANSSELETNVTKLLENSLNSVDGLKEITSSSKDNMSLITLEFEWGYNLDEAVNDIRSSIDMIYDNLPDDVSRPLIFKFNTSMMPIMQYAVTAKESYPGLEKILEDNVVNVLNRIDGIGNLSLSGAPQRYIYVDIDPQRLDAYGMSLEQVGQAISANNTNLASGSVKMGKEQYQVRVEGEYVESAEINNIVLKTTTDGKQVYVRDIAQVRDTIRDITLEEKINGEDGVRLVIMKQSGANTVQIARDVRKEMEKIKKTLPADIQVQMVYDSSENIEDAIHGLSTSILYALFFVVLVVLFFLGKWRATLIISLTIPISLLVAFIYLSFVDSSLNIISLCSLTVAIGMVVDDAIVVLENITKHIDRGASPREAAIYATNEVWVSVIATTLVIVAVFVPLTMLGGQAGIMFKELGWIVTIVVCTSTLVAISLTPMLASKLLKGKRVKVDENGHLVSDERSSSSWYERHIIKFLEKVDRVYAKMLYWCLNHKLITLLSALAFFILTMIPMAKGMVGTDFMAEQDSGRMSVTVELQRGTRIEETLKTARYLENRFVELVPEIEMVTSTTGSSDDASISSLFSSTNNNKISMTVRTNKKYQRDRSIFEIAEVLRNELGSLPEVINFQVSTATGMGAGGGSTVDVEIYGYDFDTTNKLANDFKRRFQQIEGARDVTISREEDRAELQVIFDKEKLARHGLNEQTTSVYVRNRINGYSAGYLKEDGEEYDIVVRLPEVNRSSITDIEELTIPAADGMIKLKELAEIKEYWCPPDITRKSRQRIVTVSVTPVGTSLGELATDIQSAINEMEIPQGVNINLGGTYEDQQETFGDMLTLALLILMLVYIVMASQFESFAKPFIIMFSVPFALSGVVLALLITGTNLDMIGALGIILLIGIVVKNGIVLVDYINLMRERGYSLNDAISMAGQSRLRPVLMTAFTTLLGMLPMALSKSEGSEMWVPLGIVVIGGLLVSTIITMIVVPVLYGVMARKNEKTKEQKKRKDFIFMQLSDKE